MLTPKKKQHAPFLLASALLASVVPPGCATDGGSGEPHQLEDSGTQDDDLTDVADTDDVADTEEVADTDDAEGVGHDLDVDELAADPNVLTALGDLSCVTSSNTDVVYDWGCDLLGGESCYYLTPNTDYHDDFGSGEVCQPYQTLKTQTTGMSSPVSMTHWAAWAGPSPANKSACERSHIELATYQYDQNGGGWHHRASIDRRGTWNGSSCYFGWVQSQSTATCDALNHCQTAHAVTARAYTSNPYWFPTASKVYLGTYRN